MDEYFKRMELSKSKISLFASLGQKKFRRRNSLFIVEGRKSVEDTIRHFDLEALILADNKEAGSYEVPSDKIFEASEAVRRKISSLTTVPDVMAVYRLPADPDDLPDCRVNRHGLNLILDGIQDPGNLGTIIRTAHWFGVRKIFASNDTVDVYNAKVIQSTMGSLPHVEVLYCDVVELLAQFPDMPVYGTLLSGENIYEADLKNEGFIIMGNEGKGIRDNLLSLITYALKIPPYYRDSHSESLNVAIATAITLSEFRRRSFK